MKYILSIFALATLVAIPSVQAQQHAFAGRAVGDPQKLIYRIAGIRDTGDAANVGVATTIHCTNFSLVAETVRYLLKRTNGDVVANVSKTIDAGGTEAASTHFTAMVDEDGVLAPGVSINPGSAFIFTTSPQKVICSAMIVDAAATVPQGISLHMVRFNPITNTQE
jgi:hypothetical protein